MKTVNYRSILESLVENSPDSLSSVLQTLNRVEVSLKNLEREEDIPLIFTPVPDGRGNNGEVLAISKVVTKDIPMESLPLDSTTYYPNTKTFLVDMDPEGGLPLFDSDSYIHHMPVFQKVLQPRQDSEAVIVLTRVEPTFLSKILSPTLKLINSVSVSRMYVRENGVWYMAFPSRNTAYVETCFREIPEYQSQTPVRFKSLEVPGITIPHPGVGYLNSLLEEDNLSRKYGPLIKRSLAIQDKEEDERQEKILEEARGYKALLEGLRDGASKVLAEDLLSRLGELEVEGEETVARLQDKFKKGLWDVPYSVPQASLEQLMDTITSVMDEETKSSFISAVNQILGKGEEGNANPNA